MPYARIVEGVVREVYDAPPKLGPQECALIVACAETVQKGWLFQAGVIVEPPEPDPNVALDAQIIALEATVTQRRLREAALTEAGKEWLAQVDAEIAALRAKYST